MSTLTAATARQQAISAQIAELEQEHADLDAAITALNENPALAQLLDNLNGTRTSKRGRPPGPSMPPAEREAKALAFIQRDDGGPVSQKALAAELAVSPQTVRNLVISGVGLKFTDDRPKRVTAA